MNTTVYYVLDRNGFLKQQNPALFNYSVEYKNMQSTDTRMSWLRLGWLSAHIPYDVLQTFTAVDVGSGNGTFVKEASRVFKSIASYDLVGESITTTELTTTIWDLVILSDVLEHFPDIDDFWKLQFKYALISFPEAPRKIDLITWRHYKPNEHIYVLSLTNLAKWVNKNRCIAIACGSPEDMLRTRWDRDEPNISTILIQRKK